MQDLQARKDLERLHGIRYSVLTELPYFNPARMTIIDPMHNLLLGTTKYTMNIWKELDLLDLNVVMANSNKLYCLIP